MIKIKIKSPDAKALSAKLSKEIVSSGFVSDLNQRVVEEKIKQFIAGGNSPVSGERRFRAYKDKDKYPAGRKSSRPVNLKLSGEMLDNYKAEKVSGSSVSIGISSKAPSDVKEYAEANNIGTEHIVARRFVPVSGEQFNVTVIRMIKTIFTKRIIELFNKR